MTNGTGFVPTVDWAMKETSPLVSVVIATTAEAGRSTELRRAIDSVLSQEGVPLELIVVVNGARYDPSIVERLRSDSRIRLFYRPEPSFPAALKFARSLVRGDYFAFLDDDDVYLPNAVAARLPPLLHDSSIDFVASNGTVESPSGVDVLFTDSRSINVDPLRSLLQANWLGSSAAMFRSTTVSEEFFDGTTKYYEWTLLAFKLLTGGRKVAVIDDKTFHKCDTPGSLSKIQNDASLKTAVALQEFMLANAPPRVHAALRRRLSAAHHEAADYYLTQQDLTNAWSHHVSSVALTKRYITYTRHLFRASLRAAFARAL